MWSAFPSNEKRFSIAAAKRQETFVASPAGIQEAALLARKLNSPIITRRGITRKPCRALTAKYSIGYFTGQVRGQRYLPWSVDPLKRQCQIQGTMWTKLLCEPFIKNTNFFQPFRTTWVVKRKNKAPAASSQRAPSLRRRHFVYEVVDYNQTKPQPLSVLLTKYVEDVGVPGEIVTVKEAKARYLMLTKSATYATPENIEKAGGVTEQESFSSRYVGTTIKELSKFVLNISMNAEQPWTLEPSHVRVAFRKAHVHVPESAFTMPHEKITGPDMELEGKEFYITVTINNTEKVPVRCRIHHWTTEPEKRIRPVRDHWKFPAEPIFSEDAEIAKSLPEIIPPELIEDDGPPHIRKRLKGKLTA